MKLFVEKKSLTIPMALAILLLCSLAQAGDSRRELRIAFIAYQNPDQLIEDIRPVVDYLESALDMKVRHYVATDYSGVVEALRNQTADVGFMGPLQYILARQEAGARPILGEVYNGKPYYVSRIFVRKDRGIKTLADLRGKNIAFVDPISSSGFMYPLDIFKQAGLMQGAPEDFFGRIYFAGGDEQALRAVYNGFVDAAGIGQYSYRLLRGEERDQVISIAESRRIPSHCVVVRRGLDEATTEKFRAALLALNAEGPNHHLLKNLYGVDGYIPVDHSTYQQVEDIGREFGFVK